MLLVRLRCESRLPLLTAVDTPYDTVEEAQTWWKTIDLIEVQMETVGRNNAIRLFKLPLER
jgi:2,3-dihydroxybenzoate decarboxylase